MKINKELLKHLKALYVEDDDNIRNELSSLLGNFFGKIYTAKDGKDGLETYLTNKDDIDVIISDINMPYLTGIDMMKKIREVDKEISVIFTTAYSDNEFLSDAIKIKVYDYIVKPIDVRNLIMVLGELATILYNEKLIVKQNDELEKYKDVIDANNIVIKTDAKMKITYVNELFCQTTGFDKEELLGKDFKELRHPDTDPAIYTNIYSDIFDSKAWKGRIKNIAKNEGSYICDCYVMTTLDSLGEITGALCVQKDMTDELTKKREVQLALMKDKGDIFIKSKEGSAEQQGIINKLKIEISNSEKIISSIKLERDKYLYKVEKLNNTNSNLRAEVNAYVKSSKDTKKNNPARAVKEINDLKQEINRLNIRIKEQEEVHTKRCKQLEINSQIEVEELEQELHDIQHKFNNVDNVKALSQKIEYWEEKSKSEAKKVERLEREIMQLGDESIIKRIFATK